MFGAQSAERPKQPDAKNQVGGSFEADHCEIRYADSGKTVVEGEPPHAGLRRSVHPSNRATQLALRHSKITIAPFSCNSAPPRSDEFQRRTASKSGSVSSV
ncbi:MAG: hypothetical protein WDN76_00525 [Alphaproteobacteria bacterium]